MSASMIELPCTVNTPCGAGGRLLGGLAMTVTSNAKTTQRVGCTMGIILQECVLAFLELIYESLGNLLAWARSTVFLPSTGLFYAVLCEEWSMC